MKLTPRIISRCTPIIDGGAIVGWRRKARSRKSHQTYRLAKPVPIAAGKAE